MADSIYADCLERGIPIENHESDLYIPMTPEAATLIKRHGHRATIFKSQIDGKLWYDIPFAFLPFFEKRKAE